MNKIRSNVKRKLVIILQFKAMRRGFGCLSFGMDLESLQALCKSFPFVTEDVKWGADLCFCIGGKMFLVTNPDELPVGASFKCTAEEFEVLIARPGFKPAPYLARHQWVYVEDTTLMNGSEWQHFAAQSYQLVKAKLPKKVQQDLGNL